MAAQLLDKRRAAAAAAGDALSQARSTQPWLEALPAHVDLPWLYWSDAELAELQEEDTIAEARQLATTFQSACQVTAPVVLVAHCIKSLIELVSVGCSRLRPPS
jgi:hypothetical protein